MPVVFQLHTKHSVRQSLQHCCHDFYRLFLRHIRSAWNCDAADKLRIIARTSGFAKPTPAQPAPRFPAKLVENYETGCGSAGFAEETRVSTSGPSSVMAIV